LVNGNGVAERVLARRPDAALGEQQPDQGDVAHHDHAVGAGDDLVAAHDGDHVAEHVQEHADGRGGEERLRPPVRGTDVDRRRYPAGEFRPGAPEVLDRLVPDGALEVDVAERVTLPDGEPPASHPARIRSSAESTSVARRIRSSCGLVVARRTPASE